ncbi:MAG: pyrroline-5-carboxylate reductase [Acidobacteria bacterium]|jgi:pyrroline-5-carboxylate reductase|nr:pyrroline-5-carboxylate reductase [Acidobacteriota bacterium]
MLGGKIVGIIGAGNMGEVLIRGLVHSGRVKKSDILASDLDRERLAAIEKAYGTRTMSSNAELVKKASLVILAVKPQNVDPLLEELAGSSHEHHVFVSIVAGVTTERLAERMHPRSGVIRAMPNAPASVQAGITALCPGRNVSPEDLGRVEAIFGCIGRTVILQNEALMDVVTGLSGSGPAFVFMFIESLSDAGVQLGISRKEASLLAAQTVYGAAKMLLETGKHPSELKDIVATPGGTTFAGLKMLEKCSFRSTLMEAVEAATRRSRELGALQRK